jgi:hypothetical protein
MSPSRQLVGLLLAALAARPAGATWSIVAADAETQEIVVVSATCLTGFDLKRYLPVIVVGKGGGAAQSYVDSTGQRRLIMWNGFQSGLTAQEIVNQLVALPPPPPARFRRARALRGSIASAILTLKGTDANEGLRPQGCRL